MTLMYTLKGNTPVKGHSEYNWCMNVKVTIETYVHFTYNRSIRIVRLVLRCGQLFRHVRHGHLQAAAVLLLWKR